jgi:hypothetical protein
MARSNSSRETPANVPWRLRVPAALAVAVVGASATVAMTFGGCQEESMPDPVDAGRIDRRSDAGFEDAGAGEGADASDPPDDADVPLVDDAYEPPPDAPPPH